MADHAMCRRGGENKEGYHQELEQLEHMGGWYVGPTQLQKSSSMVISIFRMQVLNFEVVPGDSDRRRVVTWYLHPNPVRSKQLSNKVVLREKIHDTL